MQHDTPPVKVASTDGLGPANEAQPLPEPAGFRTRYRSEPGMIGHYPWTYADQGRRRIERPSCEYEDLFTADQVRAAVAAERERMIADGWRQTRYAAPVTDCEACLTPDACAIRGQCGHYLRERA